jgi:hypothetical protein
MITGPLQRIPNLSTRSPDLNDPAFAAVEGGITTERQNTEKPKKVTMALMRVYNLPFLPDINMPKYVACFGSVSKAFEELSGLVYEYLYLVTSLFDSGESTVTLRYSLDPAAKNQQDRLRIFLMTRVETEAKGDIAAYLQLAESVIEPLLGSSADSMRSITFDPHTDVWEKDHNQTLKQCRYIYRVLKKDRLIPTGPAGEIQPGPGINKNNEMTRLYYLIEPFIAKDKQIDTTVFWDYLFDKLQAPAVIDLSFRRIEMDRSLLDVYLYKEINDLNLETASRRERSDGQPLPDQKIPTFLPDFVKKEYERLIEALQSGPVFEYDIKTASAMPGLGLASYVGTELTRYGKFDLDDTENKTDRPPTRESMAQGLLETAPQPDREYFTRLLLKQYPELRTAGMATIPIKRESLKTWPRIYRLKHVFPGEHARQILRLPIPKTGVLRTCYLESEYQKEKTGAPENQSRIRLGTVTGTTKRATVPLDQINKHLFVAGVTGSGKTTTVMEILSQLWIDHDVPFLVIESSKTEYRKLKTHPNPKLSSVLRVYTCGDERITPLRINPFRFDQIDISLSEHLGNLEACFDGALPLWSPIREIIMESLERVYENKHWDVNEQQSNDHCDFPVMGDLIAALNHVMADYQYSDDTARDVVTAARVRLTRLRKRAVGKVFSSLESVPDIQTLMSYPVVIEMDKLSQEHANLVTLFLLYAIRQHIKYPKGRAQRQAETSSLKHVIVVEEAHNIVGGSHHGRSSMEGSADPQAEASKFIVRMLSEVRALGQGMIIADQTPAAVAPEVMKNTGTKIVHRTVSGDDRECLAEAMLLDELQTEDLARLAPGECYLYHEALYRPALLRVDRKTIVQDDLSNRELITILSKEDWWKNQNNLQLQKLVSRWEQKIDDIRNAFFFQLERISYQDEMVKLNTDFFTPADGFRSQYEKERDRLQIELTAVFRQKDLPTPSSETTDMRNKQHRHAVPNQIAE